MRRVVAVALASAAVVIILAAPALASKDPFDPVVTSQDVTNPSTDTTSPTDTSGQPAVIGVPSDVTSDSMPTTGSDVSAWIVLAYALGVAGGVALVLAWVANGATREASHSMVMRPSSPMGKLGLKATSQG